MKRLVLSCCAGLFALTSAHAAIVRDGGFEAAPTVCDTGVIGDWTSSGTAATGASCVLPSSYGSVGGFVWPTARSGAQFLYLNNEGALDAVLEQGLGPLSGNFELSFWMAGLRQEDGAVDLGGVVEVQLGSQSRQFTVVPGLDWQEFRWSVSGAGMDTLRFSAVSGYLNLDDVHIAALRDPSPLPEPSTALLAAAGLLLALRRGRAARET